jgi:hypothetical protein
VVDVRAHAQTGDAEFREEISFGQILVFLQFSVPTQDDCVRHRQASFDHAAAEDTKSSGKHDGIHSLLKLWMRGCSLLQPDSYKSVGIPLDMLSLKFPWAGWHLICERIAMEKIAKVMTKMERMIDGSQGEGAPDSCTKNHAGT